MGKEATERRKQLLQIAETLFQKKGFDHTSIADILEEAGVARGTLYYYFKSKEEIMDAVIEGYTDAAVSTATAISREKDRSVLERFFLIIQSMNLNHDGDNSLVAYMHQPQNALMHEKTNLSLMQRITPILTSLIEEGKEQNLFHTDFPFEAVEMMLAYSLFAFGTDFLKLSPVEQAHKINAFLYAADRLFGAKEGTFSVLTSLIYGGNHEK